MVHCYRIMECTQKFQFLIKYLPVLCTQFYLCYSRSGKQLIFLTVNKMRKLTKNASTAQTDVAELR